jgi:hypothetical protein
MEDQKKVRLQLVRDRCAHGIVCSSSLCLCRALLQYPNELRFLKPEEIAALAEKIIANSTKVRTAWWSSRRRVRGRFSCPPRDAGSRRSGSAAGRPAHVREHGEGAGR